MIRVTLKKEAGFSIVQGLLMAAVLAWFALLSTKYINIQKDTLNAAMMRSKVEQVHSMIFAILQNQTHCLATLGANGASSIAPNEVINILSINMEGNPQAVFRASPTLSYLNGDVRIKSMALKLPADLSQVGTLEIDYFQPNKAKKGLGGSDISKKIHLIFQRFDATTLSSCSSVTLDEAGVLGDETLYQEICEDFGIMVWDPVLRTCAVKENTCPVGKIFTGLDATGNKICKEFKEFMPNIIDPNFNLSCEDDFDLISFMRTPGRPYKVGVECNKTGSSCPTNVAIKWSVGINNCENYITRSHDNQMRKIDAESGVGSAHFKCDAGNWVLKPGHTCRFPCPSNPSITWQTGAATCSSAIGSAENGDLRVVTDSTQTTLGTANFKCDTGEWKVESSTCKMPCAPVANQAWTIDLEDCTGNLPLTQDGQSANLADNDGATKGSASYLCESGVWTLKPGATCTGAGGVCSWTREISWSHAGCLGFETGSNPPATPQVNVPSQPACNVLCGECKGSTSYEDCTYTPN